MDVGDISGNDRGVHINAHNLLSVIYRFVVLLIHLSLCEPTLLLLKLLWSRTLVDDLNYFTFIFRFSFFSNSCLNPVPQEMQDKVVSPEKAEEAKLKARYPYLGSKPGGSDLLRKRLQKGVCFYLQTRMLWRS